MSTFKVRMWSRHSDEVTRIEIQTIDDIPNFEKKGIVYPGDLYAEYSEKGGTATTDYTLNAERAMVCFEDEDGFETTFSLNPKKKKNGIQYVDKGEVFDESDPSKSYFYFLQDWHCDEWVGEVELEGVEEILPEKLSIALRRYRYKDGSVQAFLVPDSLTYDGQPVECNNEGGDGTCGEEYWILSGGKRQEVFPVHDKGAEHPTGWTLKNPRQQKHDMAGNNGKAPKKAQAKKGPPPAKKRAVQGFQQEEEKSLTFEELLAKAKQGDARAIATLGGHLSEGNVDHPIPFVEKDIDEDAGEKVLGELAKRGNAEAQWWFGRLIEHWQGAVGKDLDYETLDWWKRAAAQGHARAMESLGQAYERGWGDAALDFAEAAKWYRMGAERGDRAARTALRELDALRAKAERWSDEEAPERLWERKNLPKAMLEFGGVVDLGMDDEESARFVLGRLFLYGNDTVPPDLERAAAFLSPAKKKARKARGKKAASDRKTPGTARAKNVVVVTVWTSDLGTISVTPVTREFADEHAGEKEPEGLAAFGPARNFHFCNGDSGAILTVKTGGLKKKTKVWANKLPQLDYAAMRNVLFDNWENPDVAEPDEDPICMGREETELWHVWRSFHHFSMPEFMRKYGRYWDYLRLETKHLDEKPGCDGTSFVGSSWAGAGKIVFEIELPDGEEFDFGKLHFLKQEDWWEETPLNEGAFWQAFGGKDVLLDYVEYDGRFHKRTDALFGLSLDYYHRFEKWQYVFGGQYLDSRFKKLKRAKRK